MIGALWRGASGMRTQQLAVDSLANDLANVNTTGYKRGRVEFADLVYRPVQEIGMPVNQPLDVAATPAPGTGVKVAAATRDFTQGSLVHTGDPLSLAIQGEGFFAVYGPGGELFLTRDGNFHRDSEGYLVNAGGYYLDVPFALPEGAEKVTITGDGTVTATVEGETWVLGEIYLYNVPNPAGLEAAGNNLFRETDASGLAAAGRPGTAGLGTIRSGYLEAANVDLAASLTGMLLARRAYELNSRSVRIADEMWDLANNLRR
ncbi:flagellar basal-body rod protein FlgG [Moorella sulfitireducens (nom. illeg.)]|uniref:flagellar basal-body rod protein FlgG n=1 Tax=Neomoorella sulfitireducens TaxID=2972948 RepID=UPI0021AC9F4D|nr:flagellar basal-body rod protein FlgG [Moorella sulfitireducens]